MNASSTAAPPPPTPVTAPSSPGSGTHPTCTHLTIFTQRWREIRDFYAQILGAAIVNEEPDRWAEMVVGGLPICLCNGEHGETLSYLHLHFFVADRQPVLRELRRRGIIVTRVGPAVNFRDPEGRVIRLSAAPATAA